MIKATEKDDDVLKTCPHCGEENTDFISDIVKCQDCGKIYLEEIKNDYSFEESRRVWSSGFRGYKKDIK